MNARLCRILLWVAAGHMVAAALFWALVNIPESSVPMLVLSAVTAAGVLFVAGLTSTAALAAAGRASGWRAAASAGVRRWPAFLLGLGLFLALWWLSGLGQGWHQVRRGELDAWLLLHLKWSRTAWLHHGLAGLLVFVRFPLAMSLALFAMATVVLGGWRAAIRLSWVRSALGWRSLATTVLVFLVCLWGPWQVVFWRPRGLPPTWVEPLFAAVKLGALYLWAHAGWAWLIVRTARRPAASAPPPASS